MTDVFVVMIALGVLAYCFRLIAHYILVPVWEVASFFFSAHSWEKTVAFINEKIPVVLLAWVIGSVLGAPVILGGWYFIARRKLISVHLAALKQTNGLQSEMIVLFEDVKVALGKAKEELGSSRSIFRQISIDTG